VNIKDKEFDFDSGSLPIKYGNNMVGVVGIFAVIAR
jgi:hypothetical protein